MKSRLLRSYIQYLWQAKTIYDIHSPFLYQLFRYIFDRKLIFYSFPTLDAVFRHFAQRKDLTLTMPASGQVKNSFVHEMSVSDVTTSKSCDIRISKQMFRLNQYLGIQRCLEIGTILGLHSLFLSHSCADRLTTLEPHKPFYDISHHLFGQFEGLSIQLQQSDLNQFVSQSSSTFDMIYIMDDRLLTDVSSAVAHCKTLLEDKGILFIYRPHHSTKSNMIWQLVCADEDFRLHIDTFEYGLAFYKGYRRQKEHLRYLPQHWVKPWKYHKGI